MLARPGLLLASIAGLAVFTEWHSASVGALAPAAAQNRVGAQPAVPLRVQRLVKRRAPLAAYVPTRLPTGYRYASHENLSRSGFDLYFSCRDPPTGPVLGFGSVKMPTRASCSQGRPTRRFRINGVLVFWSRGNNDQQAWRCMTRGRTHVLVTATCAAARDVYYWRPALQLARMIASVRRL